MRRLASKRRGARPSPSGRSRTEKGGQTREAILQAAAELYADMGVRGTGLVAIGERAGVHHATVLYHFRNSRELLLAVLEERNRRFLEFARDTWGAGGLQAIEKLPMMARFNLEHRVWAKLFTVLQVENLDEHAELHAYFVERRGQSHDRAIGLLRSAQARGDVRPDADEDVLADVILAFAAGAQIQYFLDPKRIDPVALYERFTAMLIRDLTRGE
jgi:AcrR family transcriptional regulator